MYDPPLYIVWKEDRWIAAQFQGALPPLDAVPEFLRNEDFSDAVPVFKTAVAGEDIREPGWHLWHSLKPNGEWWPASRFKTTTIAPKRSPCAIEDESPCAIEDKPPKRPRLASEDKSPRATDVE